MMIYELTYLFYVTGSCQRVGNDAEAGVSVGNAQGEAGASPDGGECGAGIVVPSVSARARTAVRDDLGGWDASAWVSARVGGLQAVEGGRPGRLRGSGKPQTFMRARGIHVDRMHLWARCALY